MKCISIPQILLLCIVGNDATCANYVNLTFDDPSLQSLSYQLAYNGYYGKAEDLLRGWSITEAGKPYTGLIAYSGAFLNGTAVHGIQLSLVDGPIYDEEYILTFSSYRPIGTSEGNGPDMTISQKGLVPDWARVLVGNGFIDASMDGHLLTAARPPGQNNVYWDVRDFAGKEAVLSFKFVGSEQGIGPTLNIFGFSAIPEPQTWALLTMGAALIALAGSNRYCK